MAFNHVLKKDSLLKPKHSIEEQIAYMNSEIYKQTYGDRPIYMTYRRNMASQWKMQSPPRLRCIDGDDRFRLNNACPVCRDEYLFFDYRNPALIRMFLKAGTTVPLPILTTGLCREQYVMLQVHLLKAKEHGELPFEVPFRKFDYSVWYNDWQDPEALAEETEKQKKSHHVYGAEAEETEGGLDPTEELDIDKFCPNPLQYFEPINPDRGNYFAQWWLKHKKFARVGNLPSGVRFPIPRRR